MRPSSTLAEMAQARDLAASGAGRAVRQAAGISLREVANAVGTCASAVYRWETGQRVPRGDAGMRWAAEMRTLLANRRGTR